MIGDSFGIITELHYDFQLVWLDGIESGLKQNADPIPERKQIPLSQSMLKLEQQLIYLQINKEFIIYMDKDTPNGQPLTIEFGGQIMYLNEPANGKINISFDDITQRLKYEIKDHSLVKINYRTVLASLKNSHPQIITAKLNKNADQIYELVITVAYQFLPEVKEVLVFQKREIAIEQSEQAASRNMRNYIKGLKEQLVALGNIQVTTGDMNNDGQTEIFLTLSHKKTVFTLGLNLKEISNTSLKVQMYYYSSITKQKKSSGAIPEDGLYINNNGSTYMEIKFLAEFQDFDMVLFRIQDKCKGDYILSSQKVQML